MNTTKELTKKQQAKFDRDREIKLFYMSMAPSQRSVRGTAKYFGVSRMTAYYAIFGRNNHK